MAWFTSEIANVSCWENTIAPRGLAKNDSCSVIISRLFIVLMYQWPIKQQRKLLLSTNYTRSISLGTLYVVIEKFLFRRNLTRVIKQRDSWHKSLTALFIRHTCTRPISTENRFSNVVRRPDTLIRINTAIVRLLLHRYHTHRNTRRTKQNTFTENNLNRSTYAQFLSAPFPPVEKQPRSASIAISLEIE